MRTLISFSTPEYRKQQEHLANGSAHFFDQVISYGPKDISPAFYTAYPQHFEDRRGYGWWIWKSMLILKHLGAMGTDDKLMYADSACIVTADPAPLFAAARRHDGIGLFHQKREGHKNSTWTKGGCFRRMGCDEPKYWDGDNLLTTYSVWTKTDKSIAFVTEWLKWCGDYMVISDAPDGPNRPDFRDHRHDQSIASILAIRDNLFTLCDCSNWGEGYRCLECNYGKIIHTQRGVTPPWARRPNMSSIIEVSTVGDCALRCRWCDQKSLEENYSGPKRLTLGMFEKCLDNLVPGDAIHFSGFTEPCLNPDIVELMKMAIGRSHCCKMYTTGRGLNVGQADAIARLPLDMLMLHLPDTKGHLSHSAGNVKILEILAEHPNAKCMAMDNTPHPEVSHIASRIHFQHNNMHDRAGNVQSGELIQVEHRRHKGPIKCGVAPQIDHSVLLPSGLISLCCMDYSLAHIVGDLSTTPYSEILRGEAINSILQKQRDERAGDVLCRKCVCAVPA